MHKFQLLCTFSDKSKLKKNIEKIKESFNIQNNKIFILENVHNTREWYITFNAEIAEDSNYKNIMSNTINIHRNKETNTLYTINALNEIIKKCNNGILDTEYQIAWKNYKNSLLLYKDSELLVINTKINSIVKWETF